MRKQMKLTKKICKGCGIEKLRSEFYLNNGHITYRCKKCTNKTRHPLVTVLANMKARCYKPTDKFWHIYGGRGIKICEEWKSSYTTFIKWSLENGWKAGLQIDRFPNKDGDYEPSNCRWVTGKVNCRNRNSNVLVVYKGETKTISEWAEITGIPYTRLHKRVTEYKWDLGKVFANTDFQFQKRKRVLICDINGEPIMYVRSIGIAATVSGADRYCVRRVLQGKQKQAHQFTFKPAV